MAPAIVGPVGGYNQVLPPQEAPQGLPSWCTSERFAAELAKTRQKTSCPNTRAAAQTQPTDLQHDYLTIQTAFAKQLLKQAPEKLTKFLQ